MKQSKLGLSICTAAGHGLEVTAAGYAVDSPPTEIWVIYHSSFLPGNAMCATKLFLRTSADLRKGNRESQHHAPPTCRLVFTLLLLLDSGTVHPLLTRSWQSAATSVLRSSMPPMTLRAMPTRRTRITRPIYQNQR